jgi:2-polyprenyl-3-methyl-5-hydroxy-6-metoxy-1,4-benzoquinol methylase
MEATPRYDTHADWYLDYTRDWGSVLADHLPASLSGQRILDLCCGYGSLSRILSARGAEVTGVDLSGRLIGRARDLQSESPAGIHYLVGNATSTQWWDGEPFDRVVCNMALMDVDDLDAVFASAAQVLRPSGLLSFSLFHPCFPGNARTRPSWPDGGYSSEGWWTTGEEGVRGHVGAHHRMLSTYLNAVIRAGLIFDQFIEPAGTLPTLIIADCRPAART